MKRWFFAIVTVALVVAATAAIGLTRPLQLAGTRAPGRLWSPPTVTAGLPPMPPLPRRAPVAAAPAAKPMTQSSPVAARSEPPPVMPPSTILVARPPDPLPARSLLPAPPPVPSPGANPAQASTAASLAGSPLAAPSSGLPAGNPVAFAPGPADSNNLWLEKPGEREQPEIHVFNRSRLRGELVIRANGAQRAWSWQHSGLVIQEAVEPIEYTYEVRGPIYRFAGRPDVAGTLRCRKFRVYEIELWERAPWEGIETMHKDLGD